MQTLDIKQVIIMISAYFREKLPDHVIEMYAQDLSDLSPDAVLNAYNQLRQDPRVRRMPLPSQVREIVSPRISREDEAREAAARIKQAVTRFGWANSLAAREHIGELGWAVVERFGGWQYLCETTKDSMWPILTAQMRDLALTVSKRTQSGLGDVAPGLPEPMKPRIDQSKQREIAQTIKEMAGKNEMK